MFEFICDVYAFIFSRKIFNKFNKFIYFISLRGLGIRNYKSDKQSGEADFLKSHLADMRNGVVIDVGANVGNYAKALLTLNPNVKIYCFEPHPRTFNKLRSTVECLGIKSFNVAVGSMDGVLNLYDYEDDDGSEHASLFKDVIEKIHGGNAVEHAVKILTLNEFADKEGLNRIALLKIDTEGNELAVLKGFDKYIVNNKVDLIHFEFNEMNVVSRVFFKDFWNLLPNYDFFRMVQDGLVPIKNYNSLLCEIFAYQNIVAKLKSEFVNN